MGKWNSTGTRVAPIFDELLARESPAWLKTLVALVSPGHAIFKDSELLDWRWGDDEIGLTAPRSLLQELALHPTQLMVRPADGRYGTDSPATRAKRMALFSGDESARSEASRLLGRLRVPSRGWCVFEGETRPDVFIETEEVVIVGEGKRKERTITTSTTWMPVRHQMLRHLDGALELAKGRQLVGLFIVEGRDQEPSAVPQEWVSGCARTVDPDVVAKSLPHRTPEERATIVKAYAGVTTWQAIVAEFDLPPELLADPGES
jgi:hypothetical protein